MKTKLIQLNNIFLSRGEKNILSNISLEIRENEIVGVLGANGAGKTTVLRVISGIWKQDSGSVILNDRELLKYSRREIATNIAYLPQTIEANVEFTVEEFLQFSRYAHRSAMKSLSLADYEAIDRAVAITKIKELIARKINELSGGEKQRIFIAGAIAQGAKILLLDEPTTFPDPHYWREQLVRWEDLGLPVVEWPTNVVSRMVPACREFHTAVVEQRLTHDADPSLARHIANATVKEDQAGTRIVKRNRGQKIDLAVASVIAYDRAHARRKPTTRHVGLEDLDFHYAPM